MRNISRFSKFIAVLFCIYFMAGMTSDRLGYLMTEFSLFFRMCVVFPVLVVLWYILVFAFEWRGSAIYKINSRGLDGWKGRVRLISMYIFGFPVLLAAFSWFTIGFPAWLAYMVAHESFEHEYIYTPDAYVAKGYKFKDALTGDRASVRVTTELYDSFPDEVSNFYAGKIVCLHGRTSIFGTIVSEVEAGRC